AAMLPAPPSSCAGWWFAQLWRAVLAEQPERHAIWLLRYPEPGEVRMRLSYGGEGSQVEAMAGSLHDGAERRCLLGWDWPGEDGMLHTLRTSWQPGEIHVRPIEWVRLRQPFPASAARPNAVPWPYRVRIRARGWHGQLLDRIELEATDGG